MLALASRDWSSCKQICAAHWAPLQRAPPRSQTAYDDDRVAQMLGGGNPETMGDSAYRCWPYGQGQPRVAMSCQAAWGLRCANVYGADWVSQVRQGLHEGVLDRPILLPVPALCRPTLSPHAEGVWSAWRRGGVPCLEDGESEVRGKALRGGDLTVSHTHGRHGQSHSRQDKLEIIEDEGILHEVKHFPCCLQEKYPCSCP